MACNIHCDCGENFGKDKENPRGWVYCGNCGDKVWNEYGYDPREDD